MAHSHADGQVDSNYFVDQLFTILTCGGVGLVGILMYQKNMLSRILVPMFYVPVLIGALAILTMVVIRAIAVWKLAGARGAASVHADDYGDDHGHSHGHEHAHEDCGHEHSHGAARGHDHAHSHAHAHSHDDSHTHGDEEAHDHGWAPWRYMVLAVPVFLFFLGFPREGLNIKPKNETLQQSPNRQGLSLLAGGPVLTKALRKAEPKRMNLRFKELTEAAAIPARQEIYEGDIGIIRGQFIPLRSSNEFTLLRVDRTCCAADEIMLETRIEAPEAIQGINQEQWVRVEGIISFQKNEKGKWIPVITLKSNDDITFAEPTLDANIP